MGCLKRLLVLGLTLSFLIVPVSASEYQPNSYYMLLVQDDIVTSIYTYPQNYSVSYPIALTTDFLPTLSIRENVESNIDDLSTYTLRFTFVGSAATTVNSSPKYLSYTNPVQGTNVRLINSIPVNLNVSVGPAYTFEAVFTSRDIPESATYLGILLDNSTFSGSTSIYLMNMYLGLTSELDSDLYDREVLERLDKIDQSINGVPDKVVDGIQGIIDAENQQGQQGSNDVEDLAGSLTNQLPTDITPLKDSLNTFFQSFITVARSDTFPLPDGNVEILGQQIDIWSGHDYVDLTPFLRNEWIRALITISRALSVLWAGWYVLQVSHLVMDWLTTERSLNDDILPPAGGGAL